MTDNTEHNHQADCLMCAVRALTEGIPPVWNPETEGESTTGVILKTGEVATDFGMVPFVDLWRGGVDRIRIMAYGSSLRHALTSAAGLVGDTLTVWYDGQRAVREGRFEGRTYKAFSANAQRGHGA